MISLSLFQNSKFVTLTAGMVASVLLASTLLMPSLAAAATRSGYAPTCTITVTPAMINGGQRAVLKWDSTGNAVFASIDNGIGNVSVDGLMIVTPKKTTTYTLHPWNARGEGGYCATTITVDGNTSAIVGATAVATAVVANNKPTVRVETLRVHPGATKVVLESVPYTGAAEDILYMLFLLSLMVTAGYVAKMHRKQIFA